MTWYQVGIVFKELLEIGWRTNVFPEITVVLKFQVGLMANTRQSPKVWSLVESVMITTITTGISEAPAVTWVAISELGTVGLSSCMSYKSHLLAIFVTVVTAAAQVICIVCFFECVSRQSVSKQSSSLIIEESLKTFTNGGSVPP